MVSHGLKRAQTGPNKIAELVAVEGEINPPTPLDRQKPTALVGDSRGLETRAQLRQPYTDRDNDRYATRTILSERVGDATTHGDARRL